MFFLYLTILLGSIRNSSLMNYAILKKEGWRGENSVPLYILTHLMDFKNWVFISV